MARLVPLNKVPLMGVFSIPFPSEVEFFLNRFKDVPGFSLPRSRKKVRGTYDRSLRSYFCRGISDDSLRLIDGSRNVLYFPHEYYNE